MTSAETLYADAQRYFPGGVTATALFNSRGLRAFHEESISEFSVTMMGASSSGWATTTIFESTIPTR